MKLYLSAMYSRGAEMRALAHSLIDAGHEITSRWIWSAYPEGSDPDHPHAAYWAMVDYVDVYEADAIIHFAETAGTVGADSGGRLVEMGMALAKECKCIVVGRGDCIFYRLPQVIRLADAGRVVDVLRMLEATAGGAADCVGIAQGANQ